MKTCLCLVLCALPALADSGVLLPTGSQQPNAGVFSLDEMRIRIVVDNGDAQVNIRQIFGSHSDTITEGNFVFALPEGAMVSDFAVWDELTRIPGVILERRRAEELYEKIKQQSIDPGLLQQGEGDEAEARRSNLFSARVVPIPHFGTKRIEIEYHQPMPVDRLRSAFVLPLQPDAYRAVTAGVLHCGTHRAGRDIVLLHRRPIRKSGVGDAQREWHVRQRHRGGWRRVLLNNRLPCFYLDDGNVNLLAPGKRTRHTISPALALKDGKPFLAWNTPGGDNQPQAMLQAFLNVVEFGMNVQQAVEAPTVTSTSFHESVYPHPIAGTLIMPKVLADQAGAALAAKGHRVVVTPLQKPYGQQPSGAGAVKMVRIDPRTGIFAAGVSPAKDDYAIGW